MKNIQLLMILALTLITGLSNAQSTTHEEARTYPKAEKGMVQNIIYLPKSVDNGDLNKKVEVYVGKYMETDQCNHYGLSGEFDSKKVDKKDWLNYYTFSTTGNAFSTLMACSDTTKRFQFVTSKPILMDYNANLPIVIYAPEGFDVHYRIFNADPQEYKATIVRSK